MANEKEDVLQANAGASAANIPDLKKKEKERKKAGAAWSGGRGAAGEFSGAAGGGVARAAASAAGLAAEEALLGAESLEGGGLWAALSRLLAGLTSTLLGKVAVAAAALLMAAGAGLLGYELLKGKGNGGLGSPDLGGIADSMRVRSGGRDRLGVNSKGEIRFDPLSAAKPPAPPVSAPPPVPAPGPENVVAKVPLTPIPQQLAHNLSGAKLTNSLGGDFGGKNIFAGNSGAPRFGAGLSNLSKIGGAKGQLSAMKASTLHATPSPRSVNKGSANQAFGQLRLAKGLSSQGAAIAPTSAEAASGAAQGAFDQQQPVGGGLATNGAPGGDTPPALGIGAPDTTVPAGPTAPMTNNSGAVDPGLQSAVSGIQSQITDAANLIKKGTLEIIAGLALVAAGIVMELTLTGWMAGAALIAAGMALGITGALDLKNGYSEMNMAMQEGKNLAASLGDNVQDAAATQYCINQAQTQATAGATITPIDQCTLPDNVANGAQSTTGENAGTSADATSINGLNQTYTNDAPTVGN